MLRVRRSTTGQEIRRTAHMWHSMASHEIPWRRAAWRRMARGMPQCLFGVVPRTILDYTILYYAMLYYNMLNHIMIYNAMLYHTILCYTITTLHYTTLCYTILYHIILHYYIITHCTAYGRGGLVLGGIFLSHHLHVLLGEVSEDAWYVIAQAVIQTTISPTKNLMGSIWDGKTSFNSS